MTHSPTVTKAMSKAQTMSIFGSVVQSAISVGSSEGAGIFGMMFDQTMQLYLPSYSRGNEREADRIGLTYMAKAGYDPRVAVELWRRASKGKKTKTNVFASHPSSGARADALEKLLPEVMPYYEEAKPKAPERKGRKG